MVEYNQNVYLSSYAIPKTKNFNYTTHGEIGHICEEIMKNGNYSIEEEKLTKMVKDNYDAVLLVCNSQTGIPEEFYTVKGALGGSLSVEEQLTWDVEKIERTYFSPATSSFSIGGTSTIHQYVFNEKGLLQEYRDTNLITAFRK